MLTGWCIRFAAQASNEPQESARAIEQRTPPVAVFDRK